MLPILTIDGPSGVGKGTIARIIAKKQGWHLLDSGAIYRALAVAVMQKSLKIDNTNSIILTAEKMDLSFEAGDNELVKVFLDGSEVSHILRAEETGQMASKLSAIGQVRQVLLQKQRDFAKSPGLVADGRDMGSVVFAEAQVKIFLEANVEVRANRRLKQLQSQGIKGIISQILSQVKERDERDKSRPISPLTPAKDAFIIDTTRLSIDEVIAKVMAKMKVFNG